MDEQIDVLFWVRCRKTKQMVYTTIKDHRYEIDPVFFNPDVLAKYRSRPSLYSIDDGLLTSNFKDPHDNWMLRSCYKTANGTVYCYLTDLGDLPYSEQKYWEEFNLKFCDENESSLGIERDFNCSFDNSPKQDLLEILKTIQQLEIGPKKLPLWIPKADLAQMHNAIMLPLVEEEKHYVDEFLLPLARLVIEGFSVSNIREWANELGVTYESKDASLNLLQKCLTHLIGLEKAKEILKSIRTLQEDKSAASSHGGKEIDFSIVQKAPIVLNDIISSLIGIAQSIRPKNELHDYFPKSLMKFSPEKSA